MVFLSICGYLLISNEQMKQELVELRAAMITADEENAAHFERNESYIRTLQKEIDTVKEDHIDYMLRQARSKANTVYVVYDSTTYHRDKNCKMILSLYEPAEVEESTIVLLGYEPCLLCCGKK